MSRGAQNARRFWGAGPRANRANRIEEVALTGGRHYYADYGNGELRIYADAGGANANGPAIVDVVTLRIPDDREPDGLLRAYGWLRVSPWADRADGSHGRRVAMVEPTAPDPALAQLARDQMVGEERRASQGWTLDRDDCWAGTSPQF